MNWIPLINEKNNNKEYVAIRKKIDDIYNVIINFKCTNSIGLLGGDCGSLLFLYYYYNLTKNDNILLIIQDKMDLIIQNIASLENASYCNGYSGICWLVRFMVNEGVINVVDIDEELYNIDQYICEYINLGLQRNDYDFLHGTLGMTYYFATQNNRNGEIAIEKFLKSLENSKITNDDGSAKWLLPTYVNVHELKNVYNLSLSHGMASFIAILSKLVKNGNNIELSESLLAQTLLYFKNNMNPSSFRSSFSPWLTSDSDLFLESRLAWCYGDPGTGFALYNAGKILNNKEIIEMALNALVKSSLRRNNKIENVIEPSFCHGTASLCHIYNRLYHETGIISFKDAALYWLDVTLEKGNQTSGYAGYIFNDIGNIDMNISLLSGLTGVGLTLLGTIYPEEPRWDECVLLS